MLEKHQKSMIQFSEMRQQIEDNYGNNNCVYFNKFNKFNFIKFQPYLYRTMKTFSDISVVSCVKLQRRNSTYSEENYLGSNQNKFTIFPLLSFISIIFKSSIQYSKCKKLKQNFYLCAKKKCECLFYNYLSYSMNYELFVMF